MKRSVQKTMLIAGLIAALMCAAPLPQSAPAGEPVAIISISGIDNVVDDIKYLTTAAGAGGFGQTAAAMSEPFTRGINRKSPIGMVVSFENDNFEPLAFVKVDDLDAAMDMLAENLGKPRDAGNGIFEIASPQRPSYVKEQNGWAFVASSIDGLKDLPANPEALLGNLNQDYDIAIRANIQNVPKQFRDMALNQMRQGIRQSMNRLPDERDEQFEMRKKLVQSQMDQMNALFEETEQVTFGWLIDGQQQLTHMDITVKAIGGSTLAGQMEGLKDSKTNFAGFLADDAAITMSSASRLTQPDIVQAKTMLQGVRETALKEIESDDDLPDQASRDAAKDLVGDLFDILTATLETGVMDGGMSISLEPKSMTLVSGLHVADGSEVEASLKKLIELAKREPDFPGIQFNADTQGDVRFHTMSVPIPEGEDARKVLGEKLDVAVGIADKAAYFAMGNNCVDKLKQVIDNSATNRGKAVDPFTMRLALTPIANFVASIEENPVVGSVLDTLKNSGGKDHVLVRAFPIPSGVTYRLQVEDGVLRAIGQGAIMAQAGGF